MVTGLVVIMMMLIECFNVWSRGRFTGSFKGRGIGQIVLSALLGAVPGCMGGFAVVSMYTHGMLSFGALVAMMIASSGDESFVMLAMIPDKAWWIFLILTGIAILVGVIVDVVHKPSAHSSVCCGNYSVHTDQEVNGGRHFSWKRASLFIGVAVFLAALVLGMLEHGGDELEAELIFGGINLLSEDWMNVMFAAFGVLVLAVIVFAGDHFINEHLWHHIVREHLPKIFLWTFGTLAVIAILLHFFNLSEWITENVALLILLSAAIGIIPESGPHLIFVTLFASGIVPLPVLVASCISQDGHAALPLLAENRRSFIVAKAVNFAVAVIVGFIWMAF